MGYFISTDKSELHMTKVGTFTSAIEMKHSQTYFIRFEMQSPGWISTEYG